MKDTECPTCGKNEFSSKKYMKQHHKMVHGESIAGFEYECSFCGEDIIKSKDKYEKAFCDRGCMGEWQSENLTDEDNPRYSGAMKEYECENCGDEFTRYKSKVSGTTFCSSDCVGEWRSENWTGKDSPVWKKVNHTTEKFTKSERKLILHRDNYTCQECGKYDCKLNAHHIQPTSTHPNLCHDIDNGITLCIECHANRHDEPIRSLVLAQKS